MSKSEILGKVLGKVRFHGKGGYDSENKRANSVLTVGEYYDVVHIDVGNWVSYYTLDGLPHTYNTVMFDDSPIFEDAKKDYWNRYFGVKK